ncbi:hypothetical protein [Sphingomonas arenae]|uniref:hypothetical protein n=1 Tax=Sphingomonas arenae TaxID=2812555 RepID=UPI00196857AF|nr:hypothetical protein [Sphingomonas arenae]
MTSAEALSAALAVLRRDELAAYTRMTDWLGRMTVGFDLPEESFVVRGGKDVLVLPEAPQPIEVKVRTDRDTVIALIDGDLQLLEAVEGRRLDLVADVSLMVPLARAARAFAEGTARARRVRPILEAYRQKCREHM